MKFIAIVQFLILVGLVSARYGDLMDYKPTPKPPCDSRECQKIVNDHCDNDWHGMSPYPKSRCRDDGGIFVEYKSNQGDQQRCCKLWSLKNNFSFQQKNLECVRRMTGKETECLRVGGDIEIDSNAYPGVVSTRCANVDFACNNKTTVPIKQIECNFSDCLKSVEKDCQSTKDESGCINSKKLFVMYVKSYAGNAKKIQMCCPTWKIDQIEQKNLACVHIMRGKNSEYLVRECVRNNIGWPSFHNFDQHLETKCAGASFKCGNNF